MSELQALFERSRLFGLKLVGLIGVPGTAESAGPAALCAVSCGLAVEHAQAVLVLFEAGLPNAACVCLRAQYEAVLRAAWALYAASPDQLERLSQPLTPESEQAAKNAPGALKMLESLQARVAQEPGIKGLVEPLVGAHAVLWRALNSFAHAGLHPLNRWSHGFPEAMAIEAVKTSNALTHFAARLWVRTGSPAARIQPVELAWQEFEDCLPAMRVSA